MPRWSRREKERIASGLENLTAITDPIELHAIALSWNWDDGLWPQHQIALHPHCDQGTALLLFWYASPVRMFESFDDASEIRGPYEREQYRLLRTLEARYGAGDFRSRRIRFDPAADWSEPYQGETLKRPIPPEMLKPSPGRRLNTDNLYLF